MTAWLGWLASLSSSILKFSMLEIGTHSIESTLRFVADLQTNLGRSFSKLGNGSRQAGKIIPSWLNLHKLGTLPDGIGSYQDETSNIHCTQ